MLKTGVAQVKIDVIHVDQVGKITVGRAPVIKKDINKNSQQLFIQVAALQNKTQIDKLAKSLKNLYQRPSKTKYEKGIYKLHLGPLTDEQEADKLLNVLKSNDYPGAYKVYSNSTYP